VCRKPDDDAAFREWLGEAGARVRMRGLASGLLPQQGHRARWPRGDGELSRFMQGLQTAQVRRSHRHAHASGPVWPGRVNALPIQPDEHLVTGLRSIERTPLGAGLMGRAEDWLGASARERGAGAAWLGPSPGPGPQDWLGWVHAPMTDAEGEAGREQKSRMSPFRSSPSVPEIDNGVTCRFT
jgi:putative transposase